MSCGEGVCVRERMGICDVWRNRVCPCTGNE